MVLRAGKQQKRPSKFHVEQKASRANFLCVCQKQSLCSETSSSLFFSLAYVDTPYPLESGVANPLFASWLWHSKSITSFTQVGGWDRAETTVTYYSKHDRLGSQVPSPYRDRWSRRDQQRIGRRKQDLCQPLSGSPSVNSYSFARTLWIVGCWARQNCPDSCQARS